MGLLHRTAAGAAAPSTAQTPPGSGPAGMPAAQTAHSSRSDQVSLGPEDNNFCLTKAVCCTVLMLPSSHAANGSQVASCVLALMLPVLHHNIPVPSVACMGHAACTASCTTTPDCFDPAQDLKHKVSAVTDLELPQQHDGLSPILAVYELPQEGALVHVEASDFLWAQVSALRPTTLLLTHPNSWCVRGVYHRHFTSSPAIAWPLLFTQMRSARPAKGLLCSSRPGAHMFNLSTPAQQLCLGKSSVIWAYASLLMHLLTVALVGTGV